MNAKHTIGPWLADIDACLVYTRLDPLTRFVVATAESGSAYEQIANTRLIAASPALYEACRKLVNSYMPERGAYALSELAEAREIALAAILKAEGEHQ